MQDAHTNSHFSISSQLLLIQTPLTKQLLFLVPLFGCLQFSNLVTHAEHHGMPEQFAYRSFSIAASCSHSFVVKFSVFDIILQQLSLRNFVYCNCTQSCELVPESDVLKLIW
jgi:hypothetical protein